MIVQRTHKRYNLVVKNFSLKFVDIMVGIVLGLGFQWWPALTEPWQYIVFVFAYLDIVDYWIDYSPSLKKFPPKREIDIFLDIGIMFAMFLYIYTTQLTVVHFFSAFVLWRIFDYFWLLSSRHEFRPTGVDRIFVNTWLHVNILEGCVTLVLIGATYLMPLAPIIWITVFCTFRIVVRVFASSRYKKAHFV